MTDTAPRLTGTSSRPHREATQHSYPPFAPSSRRCSPIFDPSWDLGSRSDSRWTSGPGMDVCDSPTPACLLSHQTRSAPCIEPGTTRGPHPCQQHCPTSGRPNSFVCKTYWRTGDRLRVRTGGLGASRVSLFGQPIAASGHKRARRTRCFLGL